MKREVERVRWEGVAICMVAERVKAGRVGEMGVMLDVRLCMDDGRLDEGVGVSGASSSSVSVS